MPEFPPRLRAAAAFLLLTLLFGSGFPVIKAGLDYFPPLWFAATRYALAAACLLGYAVATGDRWRPRERSGRLAVLAGGVLFIGGSGLLFVGQRTTTAGVAAVLFGLVPVLTAAVSWVVLPAERASLRGLVGVVVGFVGVVLVVDPDPANLLGSAAVGKALVLGAATSVTLGTVFVRRLSPPLSSVALTGWSMLLGSGLLAVAAAAVDAPLSTARLTPVSVGLFVYLAVVGGALAFVLYFSLLARFGALEVNLVTYLNPVVAATVGWLFLGEAVAAATAVGFLVIVVGFLLLKGGAVADELGRLRAAG
jgi:drug/metabolite transporter (DMT)-like permease